MTIQQQYDLLLQSLIDPTKGATFTLELDQHAQDAHTQDAGAQDDREQFTYTFYRQRWQHVPGDHAPGRLLAFARWRALMMELAQELENAEGQEDEGMSRRATILRRALLLAS